MIAQAIAQIVDSYLTNSQRSREAASKTETNLNSNVGTGKNENQLGGGGTSSYINQQTGLGENVKAIAGAIQAGSEAHNNKNSGDNNNDNNMTKEEKNDVSKKRKTSVTSGFGGKVNNTLSQIGNKGFGSKIKIG